jgi:glycosyltransferase involved in cell wall biosynthesis
MDDLLHPDLVNRYIRHMLLRRIAQIRQETTGKIDPDVSIVIRTKNDIAYIKTLLADIAAQEYTGKTEVILVDTTSTDGTVEYAKAHGANVITISQREFTYPKALNIGFRAARYPYVATLVGHSALPSRWFLRSLTCWYDTGKTFGGVYNGYLPNWNATRSERWITTLWSIAASRRPWILTKPLAGMLGANSAIVSRVAWKQFDGFDERYAAGGEDGALARQMLGEGMLVVREPLCSVLHSHSLGLFDNFRQIRDWTRMTEPLPFDGEALQRRRPDLRQKRGSSFY